MAQLGDLVRAKALVRVRRLWSERGRGLREVCRRGGDRGSSWPKGRSGWGSVGTGKIYQIDSQKRAIVRTIEFNRLVTGIDGKLWHGACEGDESDLTRVDPRTGEVLERLEIPPGVGMSGLEADDGERLLLRQDFQLVGNMRERQLFRGVPSQSRILCCSI